MTREELRDAVWGSDTHVDFDRGLAYCLSQIRAALGDSADNPRFIQTLPRRGYKFIAPVSGGDDPAGSSVRADAANVAAVRRWQAIGVLAAIAAIGLGWVSTRARPGAPDQIVIAVAIFDNETGMPEHDRLVAGLSDLVVTRLTELEPARLAVVGNAAVLRQPRNIRNLKAVADAVKAD